MEKGEKERERQRRKWEEASLRAEQEVEPPGGLPAHRECLGSRCGPHTSIAALLAGSRPPRAWAGSLKDMLSSPPFFPHMFSFQPTLKRPGNVCHETLGTLG